MGYQLIIDENVILNVYEIRIIFSTLKFMTDQSVIQMLSGSATKSRPHTPGCWPLKPGLHQNKCSRKNQY